MRWVVVPVIGLAMLVVVPLGLRLVEAPGLATIRRAWPLAGAAGVLALLLPTGWPAVLLAGVYAAATVALVGAAAARYWARISLAPTGPEGKAARNWLPIPAELAVLTALVTPSVAGLALVAERGGWMLLGFAPKILLLTVAHFHYAGFAAALVAYLVARVEPTNRWAAIGALTVPVGTLIVLLGFFLGDGVGLVGATVLTGGMWLVGGLAWRARSSAPDRATRVLLATSSAVLLVTMALALDWALGRAFGVPKLSLTWMAATHGVLNAVGFGFCAVLAWNRMPTGTKGVGPVSVGERGGRTRREAA